MLKSQLLLLLQQELRRHDFDTFIDEPPSVFPDAPTAGSQFMDHLANDVLPKVIESLKP